jgi:predicted ferric reductase
VSTFTFLPSFTEYISKIDYHIKFFSYFTVSFLVSFSSSAVWYLLHAQLMAATYSSETSIDIIFQNHRFVSVISCLTFVKHSFFKLRRWSRNYLLVRKPEYSVVSTKPATGHYTDQAGLLSLHMSTDACSCLFFDYDNFYQLNNCIIITSDLQTLFENVVSSLNERPKKTDL